MASILSTLFEHNLWANLQTVDACADLTDAQWESTVDGTMGTVRKTLQHIAAAEQAYASMLSGGKFEARFRGGDDGPGIEAVRAAIDASGSALIDMSGTAEPADTWMDRERERPASTLYIQAINHATEHRSQIFTILTQLGVEPPSVDGWTFGHGMESAG